MDPCFHRGLRPIWAKHFTLRKYLRKQVSRVQHQSSGAKRRVPLRHYGILDEEANVTLSVALPAASFLNRVHIPWRAV